MTKWNCFRLSLRVVRLAHFAIPAAIFAATVVVMVYVHALVDPLPRGSVLDPDAFVRTWPRTSKNSDANLTLSSGKRKKILYWGTYFDNEWKSANWPLGELSCPNYVECVLTDDESEYSTSDALIVHSASGTGIRFLPSKARRNPSQFWVYLTLESPLHAGKLHGTNDAINLTMTYLRSSDVLLMYGDIESGTYLGGFNQSRNYLHGKNRSVAAIVSNCLERSRLKYMRTLSKFIDVDIYGKCGDKKLCHNCWDQLKHYKFYLAFENSVCVDYVTEKFYDNGLSHGMVPVVLGGANYSNPLVAPPGSYINARNFTSVESLADFLKEVGSDSRRYNQYFRWLSSYRVRLRGYEERLCRLCTILHQSRTSKTYTDVLAWYKSAGRCDHYPLS